MSRERGAVVQIALKRRCRHPHSPGRGVQRQHGSARGRGGLEVHAVQPQRAVGGSDEQLLLVVHTQAVPWDRIVQEPCCSGRGPRAVTLHSTHESPAIPAYLSIPRIAGARARRPWSWQRGAEDRRQTGGQRHRQARCSETSDDSWLTQPCGSSNPAIVTNVTPRRNCADSCRLQARKAIKRAMAASEVQSVPRWTWCRGAP